MLQKFFFHQQSVLFILEPIKPKLVGETLSWWCPHYVDHSWWILNHFSAFQALKFRQMFLKLCPQPALYKIDCDWISGEVKENWPIDTTSMKMVWWLYLATATYLVSTHQVLLILREKPFVVARSSSLVAGDNNRHYYYSFQGHNRVKCSW